jgi:MscS family membrane protein
LANFIAVRFLHKLKDQLTKTRNLWDDLFIDAMSKPLGYLIWVVGLSWAARLVARSGEATLIEMVFLGRDVMIIALICWFIVRFVHLVEEKMVRENADKDPEEVIDATTIMAMGRLSRTAVIITGGLVIMQSLGYSVSGVLAFGGIGGIAVGFAAKDLLANFFGGFMIYMDRPFSVGEWIRSPDTEIEGTVERIGWRLTVIRTFDKRPLYVPNAVFSTIAVENPSRMQNRRIKETIGLRYDDVGKMAAVVSDVKVMLQNHVEIDSTKTLIVNFNAFAASSVDFFIYTFTKTTDWVRFHEIKQEILLLVVEIIESHGAEIAFPTSTIHLPADAGIKTQ